MSLHAWGEAEVQVRTGKKENESYERQVDHAALEAQKTAEKKIKRLLRKYRGKSREPILLLKLADIYQQMGSLEFRIAHGKNHSGKGKLNLRTYHQILRKNIDTIETLLKKYPQHPENHKAYFMRAKAYEELGKSERAAKDYRYFVENYPDAPQKTLAYMALGQFAIDQNQHEAAIRYLQEVEKHPESPQYPYALYKLAWSHYNLSQIDQALNYLENHIIYYNAKFEIQQAYSPSDLAIRDTSLSDTTVFYFQGFDQNPDRFSIEKAYDYFKSLETGAPFGKMMGRFAKLLRSNQKSKSLEQWQDLVVEKEPFRSSTMEVVLITLEHLWNEKSFDKLGTASKKLVKLYNINKKNIHSFEAYPQAQSLLLEKATELRKIILKNKKHGAIASLSQPLADLYDTFTKIVKETDPRVPAVHYNLAETLFAINQFENSTQHYRWIVDHWQKDWQVKKGVQLENSSLKAIASRYEVLRKEKKIPEKVNPKSFFDNDEDTLDLASKNWIEWIDWHTARYPKNFKQFDNFIFEANRMLYTKNAVKKAHQRLVEFAFKFPKSEFAIPSASLALDTYLKDKNWTETRTLAHRFMTVKDWKKKPFQNDLFVIAADSSYQLIKAASEDSQNDSVLAQTQSFIKRYSKSDRLQDVLFIAGKSASKLEKSQLAQQHFRMLYEKFPKSENVGPAILNHAQIYESNYQLIGAAKDYERYLSLPKKLRSMSESEVIDLKKKIMRLYWISADTSRLRLTLERKSFCVRDLEELCDQYQALISIEQPVLSPKKLVRKAIKAPRDNRPIWATAALQKQDHFTFPDRMLLARIIAGRYDDLPSEVQLNLLPYLSESLPLAFELNRQRINKFAKLKASEKSINHRVSLIKEMENTSKRVMKLPWARIRASVMNQISELYLDFSKALTSLPVPKGLPKKEIDSYKASIMSLILPFEDKGHELRSKAFEIASANAIERKDFDKIKNLFFRDNPSQADSVTGQFKQIKEIPINFKTLDLLSKNEIKAKTKFDRTEKDKNTKAFYKTQWIHAVRKKNWALVSFILKEADEKSDMDSTTLSLMRSITLVQSGAQSEGLKELNEIKSDLGEAYQSQASVILLSHYLSTYSKEKTRDLIESLENEAPGHLLKQTVGSRYEAFLVGYGALWTQASISDRNQNDLLLIAQKSRSLDIAQWAKKELRKFHEVAPKKAAKRELANE